MAKRQEMDNSRQPAAAAAQELSPGVKLLRTLAGHRRRLEVDADYVERSSTMRLSVLVCVLCCVFVFVVGCSCEERAQVRGAAPPAGQDLPAPGGETSPSLGSLRTREATIRIEAGPRFSVFGSDGSPVARSLSKAEFRRMLPDLYEAYESAVAGRDSGVIVIDASSNTPQELPTVP